MRVHKTVVGLQLFVAILTQYLKRTFSRKSCVMHTFGSRGYAVTSLLFVVLTNLISFLAYITCHGISCLVLVTSVNCYQPVLGFASAVQCS